MGWDDALLTGRLTDHWQDSTEGYLYIVSGLSSSGFGRGPMAGKLAADYIHTGNMPDVLAESDPARCVTEVA